MNINGFIRDDNTGVYYREADHPIVTSLATKKQILANRNVLKLWNEKLCKRKHNLVQTLFNQQINGNSDRELLKQINLKSIEQMKLVSTCKLEIPYGPVRIVHVKRNRSFLSLTNAISDRYHYNIYFQIDDNNRNGKLTILNKLFDGTLYDSHYCYINPQVRFKDNVYVCLNAGGTHPTKRYWYLKTYFFQVDQPFPYECLPDFWFINLSKTFGQNYNYVASCRLSTEDDDFLKSYARANFAILGCCMKNIKQGPQFPVLKSIDIRYEHEKDTLKPNCAIAAYNNLKVRYNTFRYKKDGDIIFTTRLGESLIRDIRFLDNDFQFVASGDESFLKMYDIRMMKRRRDNTVKALHNFTEHKSSYHYHQINFDPNTNLLALSGNDNMIRFWDIKTGQLVHYFYDDTLLYDNEHYPMQVFYTNEFKYSKNIVSDALVIIYANQFSIYSSNFPSDYQIIQSGPHTF